MARLFSVISKSSFDLALSIPGVTTHGQGMHGWGIGWYDAMGAPHIQKGKRSATQISRNQPVTLSLTSYLAISHLRFASSGTITDENVHPFQFHSWVFAHSGSVHKEKIYSFLKPPYNQNFQSEPIDSEIYFRFVLQSMKEFGETAGLKHATQQSSSTRESTFVMSDGTTLYAHSHGIPLYWLKWKGQKPFTAKAPETGTIYQSNQLISMPAVIVASERLSEDNWMVMDDGEMLIVRKNLTYQTFKLTINP